MIGRTLSHFRIIEKIGEGGMGVVYRAEDERLRRPVALKVLPPDLVRDEERRLRFLREARAAAAVNHTNIATVYEIDEADGTVFIAMELVEGKTLRDLVARGPMTVREVVRIASQMADGLARAHQAHVIHRDLKPDNVIVGVDGHAKILDFGLAKLLEEQAGVVHPDLSRLKTISRDMTREGRIFGTAAYMSPEQARGQVVDARSDLFSFGTTLYEMATGRLPFEGATATDVMSAIIRDDPSPASAHNPGVPAELDRIITECLEKDPADRYQHTDQLAVDLRKLRRSTDSGVQAVRTPGAPLAADRGPVEGLRRRRLWIVALAVAAALVLAGSATAWWRTRAPAPFRQGDRLLVADLENRSGEADLEAAVRDALEHMLANSQFVDVVRGKRRSDLLSTRTTGSFTRVDPILAERLAAAGGLAGYVTGEIAREGTGYYIGAALHRTGSSRRSATFSESVKSREEILHAVHLIALGLRRGLGESAQALASDLQPTTRSIAAYQAFVMADWVDEGQMDEAEPIALLKRAIEIDPGFLEGYQALGVSYWNTSKFDLWRQMVGEAYRRAQGQPDQVRLWYEIDWLEANWDYDIEIERLQAYGRLFPGDPRPSNYLAILFGYTADENDVAAEGAARENLRLGPRNPVGLDILTAYLARQGKFDEVRLAVDEFRRSGGLEKYAVWSQSVVDFARGDWKGLADSADRLERDHHTTGSLPADLRLRAALGAGRLGEAERQAATLAKDAARESMGFLQIEASISRIWLVARRTGHSPPLPPEVAVLAEADLGGVRQLAAYSVDLRLTEPLEHVIGVLERRAGGSPPRLVREELQFARGCLALVRGRAGEARDLLEPITRGSAFHARHFVLAQAFEELGLWRDAAAEYELILENAYKARFYAPLSLLDRFRLARVYERLGDSARARQQYEQFLTDWKDADPDIPEVIEARKRLLELGGTAPKTWQPGGAAPR
jgi:predicted Ser/Thr protein kinase/tetratricopeptide (TPR) repeat protein